MSLLPGEGVAKMSAALRDQFLLDEIDEMTHGLH